VKALLDTNSLVSVLLRPDGVSNQIFQRWRAGQFQLATSPGILVELTDVLHRRHIFEKYHLTEVVVDDHLTALRTEAEVAPGLLVLDAVPDDPKDNHVLAAAVETSCEYIVSGDRHLLDLHDYQGIKIVSPREFLALLSP
jgi:putative PIN family toxin of toxin-antitoxin system